MKKKLILANNRSRLVSLRNLRKGWYTFLHQVYPEGNYPIIPEHRLREIPLKTWLSFFIYFAEKRSFFCVGVTLFYVCILLNISPSVEFVKWLFNNILRKLIFKIKEISKAVIFKQNLLVLKTALVKLAQNVLW